MNRLTTLTVSNGQVNLASYAYTLGASGNRTQVIEGNGRAVNYGYDDLYRLTSETINNSPNSGQITYQYDAVGNRLNRNSSVNLVPSVNSTFDNNDRLTSDGYDNNGSTKLSNGKSYNYDFENKLTSTSDGVTIGYDGDGNRVSKTINGVTTFYLVDTNNLTGYAQVVEELQNGVGVVKSYTYGLDLISQRSSSGVNFYQYDGHGSVRGLTDSNAQLTDTYSYDAFGTLIERTGNTANSYLYSGEQFDTDLGFYYNRARYLNVETGRFISMDSYEGSLSDPLSLHKYLYASNNPVNLIDPSGNYGIADLKVTLANIGVLVTMNAARLIPPLVIVGWRIANWIFANQIKLEWAWTRLSLVASLLLESANLTLMNNEDPITFNDDSVGDWVEQKVGANATEYKIIDDFSDGNVTSIKSKSGTMERVLKEIRKEAETLGNKNSDFQPNPQHANLVKPIPIQSVKTRTVLMVIPENHFHFLSNPTFIKTIKEIQQTTKTVVSVVPLKGWKK